MDNFQKQKLDTGLMVKVNKIGMQMGTNSTPLLAGKLKKKKKGSM